VSAPPGRGAAPASADDGRPPLGGWGRLYALVIAALAADVLLLLWLTDRFR
jgi:hypothetical protein